MENHITSKCERERRFKQGKENKYYNLTSIGVFDFNRGCYVLWVIVSAIINTYYFIATIEERGDIYARRNLFSRMCHNSRRTGGTGNNKRIAV